MSTGKYSETFPLKNRALVFCINSYLFILFPWDSIHSNNCRPWLPKQTANHARFRAESGYIVRGFKRIIIALQNFYYLVVLLQFADYILLCFQATKPWTFALWMDVCLHNEKMIPLFCYNVPGLAVYYKLNRRLFTANRISISFLKLLASSCLYSQHKPDTSLKDGQSGPVPEAALLTESWL